MTVTIHKRGGNVVRAMLDVKPPSARTATTEIDAELSKLALTRVGSIGKADRGGRGYLVCIGGHR